MLPCWQVWSFENTSTQSNRLYERDKLQNDVILQISNIKAYLIDVLQKRLVHWGFVNKMYD